MFSNTENGFEVSIRMLDGATLRGTLSKGHNSGLEAILSKETPFLEFISKDGQRKFLSKHQIAYVEPVEPLRKPTLAPKNDPRFVDAFTFMGLQRNCSLEEAKSAFHRMAKMYHPDTFSGYDLPEEVQRYVASMFKQVNTAFTEVKSELQLAA